MITETTSTPAVRASAGVYRHVFVPSQAYKLLLAIDNDDNAPAAIRITAALQHRGAEPRVLRALELMTPVAGGNAADTVMLYSQAALGPEFYAVILTAARELEAAVPLDKFPLVQLA